MRTKYNNQTKEWCGHVFIRVTKKQFNKFIRIFRSKIEGNGFMGWLDFYDWSLNNNLKITKRTSHKKMEENLDKCMVARKYYETPKPEYWLRLDYIRDYDIALLKKVFVGGGIEI